MDPWVRRPVVMFELFVLITFFTGLIFAGGQSEQAVWNAIGSGFWASWFWYGVIGVGMVLPLLLNAVTPTSIRHSSVYIFSVTSLSLMGVLMLRTFCPLCRAVNDSLISLKFISEWMLDT